MTQHAPLSFQAPGPGVWMLDATHCPRPRSRYTTELFGRLYVEGFRAGFARYGALLDTIEVASVNGFAYMSPRPLGAPPGAKKMPPKLLFQLLTKLHPGIRARIKRCEEVIAQKIWRQDAQTYLTKTRPSFERRLSSLQEVDLTALSDEELLRHVEQTREALNDTMLDHFMFASATMIPVGDYLAHVTAHTKCSPRDALFVLKGFSPDSIWTTKELTAAISAIEQSDTAKAILEEKRSAAQKIEALQGLAEIGPALTSWLRRFGYCLTSGFDLTEHYLREMPELIVALLCTRRAPGLEAQNKLDAENATFQLRAKVPANERADFDERLAEARATYQLRDARASIDYWSIGLMRRAILEVGARLVRGGRLHKAEHAAELLHQELYSQLRDSGPSLKERTASAAAYQQRTTSHQAPVFLGGTPGEPPPADWLPPAAARVTRAANAYMSLMNEDRREPETAGVMRGQAASQGTYTGTARLVLTPEDFSSVQKGDVLITITTSPPYNVLFPLLGAVVTDLGGLLSHPAIVSREYGIPAVIGARSATLQIKTGMRVEVNGNDGTVRVVG